MTRAARPLAAGVDVGGTFTDCAAITPDGIVLTRKVLSTPEDQGIGVVAALEALAPGDGTVTRLVHGTTVVTNLLLERTGARVVLCATAGASDLLELRRQERASLYDLAAQHPPPLVAPDHVVPVQERLASPGSSLPLTDDETARVVEATLALGPDVVVIALLHAYADDTHERRLAEAFHRVRPALPVVRAADVLPEIREYERSTTAVAEGYARPGVQRYLERLGARLAAGGLPATAVMTSGGGMRSAEEAAQHAASLALSGPAGGVVGAAAVLRALGLRDALTIDIGGTSADAGLILDGEPLVEPGGMVAGVPISLPRVLVETVSAGGGSIAWVDDGGALRVGPRSAGSRPGPAAFGRGGTEPTVTDAQIALGRIDAAAMSGGVALDAAAARAALQRVATRLGATLDRTAEAVIRAADAEMARALRRVSVDRGVDPRGCALLAFGGGGPLHACALADALGMRTVIVPPHAGVLSAVGLAIAPERREVATSLLTATDALDAATLRAACERLAERVPGRDRRWIVRARYQGQGHEVEVSTAPGDDGPTIAERFARAHHARYGFVLPRPVECVALRHVASDPGAHVDFHAASAADGAAPPSAAPAAFDGPATRTLRDATLFVAAGWRATPLAIGGWRLDRLDDPAARPAGESAQAAPAAPATLDPLELSVWASTVSMIAEEMGAVLTRGALSPNIRERRDASCALFDAEGRMVAQAAHIPVHLGALPESVRAVRARAPQPGDVFLLNSPWHGGSHLPDLTMVEAIADGDRIAGYAVVRAHHADVGGMSPGSMPQGATELVQEGLVLPPVRLERAGVPDPDLLDLVLANVRTPEERRGDLAAQRAACAAGAAGWRTLLTRHGRERLTAVSAGLLDYAERRAVARLRAIDGVTGSAEDALEGDGRSDAAVPLRLALRVASGVLHLDFAGSSPMVPGNVNCPIQVTRAAALFVLRALLDDDVPTNEGIARPIRIVTPDDCCLAARAPAAVAAGNVEMSQRITDLLFAALDAAGVAVPAQGQGTMNNVTFGGAGWTFYETLGGGQGASAKGPGPDAVHVGMSNTRNTPIESLERAYPIEIVRYAIRRGSGGRGTHRGGDGVLRAYRVLAPCTVTLLTERRARGPRGAHGGEDGLPGENRLNGVLLPAKCRRELAPGDVLELWTPGGGGWGPPA